MHVEYRIFPYQPDNTVFASQPHNTDIMAKSQKHAITGVEDIVVYKGDLISELRKAQHILRDIVRDSRCCVCWDVLQRTYVGQCGHSICMKVRVSQDNVGLIC